MYYLVLYKMPVALRYPARISTQVQVIYSRFTSESYSRGGLAWSQVGMHLAPVRLRPSPHESLIRCGGDHRRLLH
jgi:hypothetical protein